MKVIELSPRLSCIDSMITADYDDIWDMCCDHGLLGFALLQRQAASRVHFVDQVSEIMTPLADKLRRFAPQANWQVHCMDAATAQLADAGRQLVIIAGVGGDKTIELVSALSASHPGQDVEFILCPVHHNYALRERLIELGFALIDERLLAENKRHYEVLHIAKSASVASVASVSSVSSAALTPTGSVMWDLSRAQHQQYLAQCIAHYQRKAQSGDKQAADIAAQYQLLKTKPPQEPGKTA